LKGGGSVTDSSRAEGWWRAPDGQWYAPAEGIETHDFDDDNGAVPAHRHPNGGGWIANSATVAETAHVGPLAGVSNLANVLDTASVLDNARVLGQAQISGNAKIHGDALVGGYARVCDHAEVFDNASVTGRVNLYDHAQVSGFSKLIEPCSVIGNTRIFDAADSSDISVPPEMATCANGHTVDADASFCTICGEPKLSVPENERSCPACGAEAVPCSSFCVTCGHSLSDLKEDLGALDSLPESSNAEGKQRDDELDNAPTNQPVIPQTFIADELAKLGALRDSGLLTDEEFAQQKSKLLNS
jgi:hypothetical protein